MTLHISSFTGVFALLVLAVCVGTWRVMRARNTTLFDFEGCGGCLIAVAAGLVAVGLLLGKLLA